MQKLILEARLNEYTPRTPNPHVPFSPEELARDAAACREAGASIVHFHAREPSSGAPSIEIRLYLEAARRIREACDVLIMPTLGANTIVDLDQRFVHVEAMAKSPETRADLVPLDLASTNLPIWSPGAAEIAGRDLAYYNTVATLETLAARAAAVEALPMAAIWGVGSLRLLEALVETGALPRTIYTELFLTEGGLLAGHPATLRGLEALLDFLPESVDCVWAVAGYGANVLELAEIAIERGGHVALGLGDHAYLEIAEAAPTNAEVIAEVAAIARRNGRELATPAETWAILNGES
jgi:uncharacterized protein (DUF849 family)